VRAASVRERRRRVGAAVATGVAGAAEAATARELATVQGQIRKLFESYSKS
jgi:hypothetical protein